MKPFLATDYRVIIYHSQYYASKKFATVLKRYADKFGKVILATRFIKNDKLSSSEIEISEFILDTVNITSVYKTMCYGNQKLIDEKMKGCDIAIIRCPSIVACRATDIARKNNIPCLSEVMSCAWDDYWNHGVVGKLLAPYMYLKTRKVTKQADYALYVTSEFLQRRYPNNKLCLAASNVEIRIPSNEVLNNKLRQISCMSSNHICLMTAAAVNVIAKGQKYVIRAIAELRKQGIEARYILAGGGDNSYLRKLAKKLNVDDLVIFTGNIPNDEVLEYMDKCDVYIQPSLQEGLPRAVIEAMSRGCICVGARTAGIPELLSDEFLVRRKSVSDIVGAVKRICSLSDDEKKKVAERNYKKSKEYETTILNLRRQKFFSQIVDEIGGE